ncbi:hypothetical protein TWF696_007415 [Orbilia brochopaga]|uniref:Uncharacterized protein n=1 Tax=Orbilia brochopaga TaxID=3140254 RepID=A0AAV9UV53_9PEZI
MSGKIFWYCLPSRFRNTRLAKRLRERARLALGPHRARRRSAARLRRANQHEVPQVHESRRSVDLNYLQTLLGEKNDWRTADLTTTVEKIQSFVRHNSWGLRDYVPSRYVTPQESPVGSFHDVQEWAGEEGDEEEGSFCSCEEGDEGDGAEEESRMC